jgi:ABC-2 type transport system ATP-binding protein
VKTFSRGTVLALNHVSLSVYFGEITAIAGANGSGKSTLLRLFFGLAKPDAGHIRTLDREPFETGRVIRSRVAYVSQRQELDPEMTGQETMTLFCALYGLRGKVRRQRIEFLTESFGLERFLPRRISEYSGGYRQRLHLAIGMIHEPQLLLLDEPTSGLDPQGRTIFWETMRSLVENGGAVAVVTHDLDDAARYAKQVVLLSDGQVRIAGRPQDIVLQHGQTVLQLTLAQHPENWKSVEERLKALNGVTILSMQQSRVIVYIDAAGELEARVIAAVNEAGLDVVSLRRENPSLASAYMQLTGRVLTADENRSQSHRRRGRS